MRNKETGLIGNTIDNISLEWINANSGIGSGIDSFYEVLFKVTVFFLNGINLFKNFIIIDIHNVWKY